MCQDGMDESKAVYEGSGMGATVRGADYGVAGVKKGILR